MTMLDRTVDQLLVALEAHADPEFAESAQRYFPDEIVTHGVRNPVIADIAAGFVAANPDLLPEDRLAVADELIARATNHEEVLLGFALLYKVARRSLGPELLDHCLTWLEDGVTNWAQCDDLCLKLLYPFFLGHLDLIPDTRQWVESPSPWARRAANVAVVKFIRRKVGREVYELPVSHVFDNCTRLIFDEDDYVQKGCGWLLKVTAVVHPQEVSDFLRAWHGDMKRDTFRYAIEKMGQAERSDLMALGAGGRR